MGAMPKILHFSTVDADADMIAAVGELPMPTGPARVRLFFTGGGVIDVSETREQVREIWLNKDSQEARFGSMVEENRDLRVLYGRMAIALSHAVKDSPKEDMWRTIETASSMLKEYLGG